MALLTFDKTELAPLIEQVAETVLRKLETKFGDQIAFSESQAARLLGMSKSQLKSERDAGRLNFKRVGERGIRYSKQHLLDYLNR